MMLAVVGDQIVLWLLGIFGTTSVLLLSFIASKVWDMASKLAGVSERMSMYGISIDEHEKRIGVLSDKVLSMEFANGHKHPGGAK